MWKFLKLNNLHRFGGRDQLAIEFNIQIPKQLWSKTIVWDLGFWNLDRKSNRYCFKIKTMVWIFRYNERQNLVVIIASIMRFANFRINLINTSSNYYDITQYWSVLLLVRYKVRYLDRVTARCKEGRVWLEEPCIL